MRSVNKISEAELEVMKILWREGKPLCFSEIREELEKTKRWNISTINTLVRRLTHKDAIEAQKHGIAFYTPNVTETEYIQAEEQIMLDKLHGGSARKFVAALCQTGRLSENDIDEMKKFFKADDDE